jgi:hypothetical protein
MATWKISNYHKKNCVEKQFWRKDDKSFTREEGFRWGSFFCESDERPDVDLKNPDGFEPYWGEIDWELIEMFDGCWGELEFDEDWTEEEKEEIERLWEEEGYSGLEEAGWSNDDTETVLYGPLLLENEDTGERWNGDEPTVKEVIEEGLKKYNEMMAEPVKTEWYPVKVNPVRKGLYECETGVVETSWPFPKYEMIQWTGRSWKTKEVVRQWRGLDKEPK